MVFDGLAIRRSCLLVFSLVVESQSLIGIRGGILRSDFNGLVELRHRFRILASSVEGLAEIVEGVRVLRVNLQGFPETGDGLVVFLLVQVVESALIELGRLLGNSLAIVSAG